MNGIIAAVLLLAVSKNKKKMMNAMSFFALLCIPFLAGHRIDRHGPEMGLLGST
jgi:hypothetical protein